MHYPNLTTYSGAAGVGKTSRVMAWGPDVTVTYTRAAASEIRSRLGPDSPKVAGTIYSLAWPHQKLLRTVRAGSGSGSVPLPYNKRKIRNGFDPALDAYSKNAPSKKPRTENDRLARLLHAWDGQGDPPFDLAEAKATGALTYVLPLAKWVADGCPLDPDIPVPSTLAVDEAQDVSALELAACMGLSPSGMVRSYGDPGQSLYAEAKGLTGSELPAAWTSAAQVETLVGGWRCGNPVAARASRILAPYWNHAPETFAASHSTEVRLWLPDSQPPRGSGLVLAHGRDYAVKFARQWGLRDFPVVPADFTSTSKDLIVCTAHAAKGAEADNVYLLPWSWQAMGQLQAKDSARLRLMYVAMTRARKVLHVPPALYGEIG